MNNLPSDFLYHKIPQGVLSEDLRLLLRAVVGGFQTQLAEMRTLADQITQLWVPDNTVGEPYQVIVVTYIDPNTSETRQITLNVLDSTPDQNAPTASVYTWCAGQVGVDVSQIAALEYTTDQARTAENRTLQLLADTIGAHLYADLGTTDSEIILNQKRALKTYFARLKIKGTALSFNLLGRLHGFDDVKFTPLWGRVSPRIPNSVGDIANDPDFSQSPQGLPTPGQPSALYNPTVLNDGDIFIWQSGLLGVDASQTDYIESNINGFNPYIIIEAVGGTTATLLLPLPGTYYLSGGTYGRKATTDILPAANGALSGFQFVAITDTASFNGTQVVIKSGVATDGTPRVIVTVYHNLSSIKFRTSYFNLAAAVSYDSYVTGNTTTAQTSPDLKATPTLWQGLSSQFPANSVPFANSGVASDPFRPWVSGTVPMPNVQTWPDVSVTAGSGTPTPRVQASISTPALDLSKLLAGGILFTGHIDDVRPATRDLRRFTSGLSLTHQVRYAPHVSRRLLTRITGIGSQPLSGLASAGSVGVDYPSAPFTGFFKVYVQLFTFDLSGNFVSKVDTWFNVASETEPTNANRVDLSFVYPNKPTLLAFTGLFDFSAAQYSVTTTAYGYSDANFQYSVLAFLYGYWEAIGTDRLQAEPAAQGTEQTLLVTIPLQ